MDLNNLITISGVVESKTEFVAILSVLQSFVNFEYKKQKTFTDHTYTLKILNNQNTQTAFFTYQTF